MQRKAPAGHYVGWGFLIGLPDPNLLLQFLTIAGNDILVPPERFLAVAGQCAAAIIMTVDIDEAVALGQLGGRGADEVNAAPGRIAHDRNSVLDGLADLY